MCGRFSQAYSWDEIVAFSQPLTVPADRPNLRARYNISPTTEIDMIVLTEAGRELRKARWGLIPGWWKKTAKETGSTFNARIEGAATSAIFRSARGQAALHHSSLRLLRMDWPEGRAHPSPYKRGRWRADGFRWALGSLD